MRALVLTVEDPDRVVKDRHSWVGLRELRGRGTIRIALVGDQEQIDLILEAFRRGAR